MSQMSTILLLLNGKFLAIVFAYCVIFYGQAYHRDLLVHKASPGAATTHHQVVLPGTSLAGKNPGKRSSKRGKGEKRSGSKRHRKVAAGNKDSSSF